MRALPAHKRAEQTGMTLVEVMVAMVLTAILLVGMNALWVEISREVDALVLRQKAIFRLNGEMERLVGLYAMGEMSVFPPNVTSPTPGLAVPVTNYETGAPANKGSYIGSTPVVTANSLWINETENAIFEPRYIYPATKSGPHLSPSFMVSDADGDAAQFSEPLSSGADLYNPAIPSSADGIYSKLLYWNAGTSANPNDDRNVVWLDRDRKITAQLSWSYVKSDNDSRHKCYSSAASSSERTRCRHVTMYLDYPFRFVSTSNPLSIIEGIPVETVTLQTIVSERPR